MIATLPWLSPVSYTHLLLRGVIASLRIEHDQIAVAAALVAPLRELKGALRRIDQRLLRRALTRERCGQCQSIGDLAKAGLDSLLILGHCNIAIHIRDRQVGSQRTAMKNRQCGLGYELSLIHI